MSEWKECKLGEICNKIGSGATPTGGKDAYKGGDFALIRSQNVLDHGFSKNGLAFIDDSQARKLENVTVESNDILLNITGDSVARTCIVDSSVLPARVNQHVAIVRVNSNIADSRFIHAWLIYKKAELLNLASFGATRNAITKKMIENFSVNLPSLAEQRSIAGILSSLDEKIETNRKINARLEELAQAIFKSWFIDFEPFGGKMPEDWKTSAVEDFFKIDIGKTPPRKESQWFSLNDEDVTWVSISDMGKYGMFISDSSELLTYEAVKKYNITIVPQNTILLSFKLTIGRVCIANSTLTTNEAIARFRLNSSFEREFLYLFLKQFDYNSLGSTSSIATAVNSKIIKGMPIFIPHEKVLKDFSALISPIFNRIESLTKESARLAALRDTLLPKLMSGELIPEI